MDEDLSKIAARVGLGDLGKAGKGQFLGIQIGSLRHTGVVIGRPEVLLERHLLVRSRPEGIPRGQTGVHAENRRTTAIGHHGCVGEIPWALKVSSALAPSGVSLITGEVVGYKLRASRRALRCGSGSGTVGLLGGGNRNMLPLGATSLAWPGEKKKPGP